ncbi:MAG: phosphatidate cytidylyltransferase [Desulfobacula sp.]|uniref:phosphatidate cytidylyltransferase n=1 Tax=Desulfobacula sp. TaxID=2593537 RepID=UPI0025C24C74|nr:phosphatidate cytidylyltransferase [Desulfobacula sp.]MCD4719767.1 phosphatidate cytidylyltransferase [Desulfobacula sp.]
MQHIKRWITALVLAPILLWIVIKGNTLLFAVLVSVVAVFAMGEYLRIIFKNDEESISNTIKIISYIVSMTLVISACLGSWEILFLIIAMNLLALSIFVLSRFAGNHAIFDIIAKQVLGVVYIPVSLSLLVFIKDLDGGTFWIIWLLIVIFANDTGAFYTGTFFGKRAFSPNISPNKTIEGSLGGVTTSMIVGFIFCQIFFNDLSLSFLTIPASFLLAGAGQIGDLFESAMKRSSNIKDSGRILPGHGGMLDRIDGLLLAIPVLYVYRVFIL